jgi:hypothetical protein
VAGENLDLNQVISDSQEVRAPASGSPQLEAFVQQAAGNPAGCTDMDGNPLPADQRYGLRPDHCDMGAFEFDALVERLNLPAVLKD